MRADKPRADEADQLDMDAAHIAAFLRNQNSACDLSSDPRFVLTPSTERSVLAARVSPDEWVVAIKSLQARAQSARGEEKRAHMAQLFLFMAYTRRAWIQRARFVAVIRQRLLHFRTADNWDAAFYFEQMLFPQA